MDTLFPALPKELAKLEDKEINDLLAEHEQAAGLIDADDAEFLKDLSADEIIEQYRSGAEQIKTLRAELKAREDAAEAFVAAKAEIGAEIKGETVEEPEPEPDDPDAENEVNAEAETADEPETPAETVEEREPVLVADAATEPEPEKEPVRMRRPVPTPAADRIVVNEEPDKTLSFVASGFLPNTPTGKPFASPIEIAEAEKSLVRSLTPNHKRADGREERFPVAQLDYKANFPDERTLFAKDVEGNSEKIAAIGSPFFGKESREALVASGGLCAPLTPIYSIPNFAVTDRPVRDALPNFRAERGGVNVPTPHTIADADGSVTVITESADALGGTFATKACLDFTCPTYTETAVTIIAACREFGNLNAMAWPESVAHENALTAAFHARTAEGYLLDQIKALSIAVTSGADTLGALIYFVDAIVKARFGIIGRLRMDPETVFTCLLPSWLPDYLQLDTVQNPYDRYKSEEELVTYLRGLDINPVFYMDTPSTGDSQLPDSAQTAAAIDDFPATVQAGLFPAGEFLHIDMAELNLGIVRDSTLNSTNDFQYFYETFENVARIGPAQAAYWITLDLCPSGVLPALGTAVTCS